MVEAKRENLVLNPRALENSKFSGKVKGKKKKIGFLRIFF